MRFPVKFSRWKGSGGTPVLGSDGAAGTPPTSAPSASMVNLLATKFCSNQGWPAHRIAVGYSGPTSAVALAAQVWVYDHASQAWYEVGAPTNIVANRITFFDVVALLDAPNNQRDLMSPSAGSLEALLVVQDGSTPDGEYVFTMGADLTVLPV